MKKRTLNTILLSGLLATTFACANDDNNNSIENQNDTALTESEIPTEIKAYKNEHFPSNDIISASKEVKSTGIVYDLKLTGAIELEFDNAYRVTDIDGTSELPPSVIPQPILDYIAQNYPNNVITDWEVEANHQEIELDNGLDLEFQMDGTFIRIDVDDNDNDDDDNDTYLNQNEIPNDILVYLDQHFQNISIVSAVEELDDNVTSYEIYLNGDIELEFDANYNVTSIESYNALPNSVIQQEILDYVTQNYPNNVITDWELETTHQQIELDNGTEIEFQMNGTFIRVDNDDETTIPANEVPSEITAYVNQHFPNNTIITAEEDVDGNVTTYEVTLSGNIELEFNANYDVTEIESATQLPNSVIQQELLDYVAQNYPNNTILSWEIEGNHQEIELNNDLELEFQMNGAFIRIDND